MFSSDPTLLVVEDASDHAALVRVAARRAFPGLDVRVAGDGREGIAYLAGCPPFQDRGSHPFPDLMILDLIMPDIDGFGVLEWIAEARHSRPLPVVVLTSSSNAREESRALALGAAAFYRKPPKLEALGELVRDIIQTWMQTRLPSRTQLRLSSVDEARSSRPA